MAEENFDPRSLALFRVALGGLLFGLWAPLFHDFDAFYGSAGISSSPAWERSLLKPLIEVGLPLLAGCLILGLATRLVLLLSFLGVVLIQAASPPILQGGDVLLRLLLFWSLFLPLSPAWSWDAQWQKISTGLPWMSAGARWAFTLQICFVYWFAALLKSDPLWTQSGNALFYALNIEHFTTPFGLYLRQCPDFLRFLTFGTLGLEFLGPLFLLSPFYRRRCRMVAVILFVSFHLIGMQSLLRIGFFPWVCATAWLPFIPDFFWDRLGLKAGQIPETKEKKRALQTTEFEAWPALDRSCTVFIVAALLDVLAWNIASVQGSGAVSWMRQHDWVGHTLRLEQCWNMYAPQPRSEHGWLVAPAELANGERVDLFTRQPISFDKPTDLGAYMGDFRWRRYLSNLFEDRDPEMLQNYAHYLVEHWNQSHDADQKVQAVTIIFMKQVTLPSLAVTPPVKEVLYFQEL